MKDIVFKQDNIKFNFRVAVMIENNDKLLFEKRQEQSGYILVGGKVKLNETAIQAIIREIKDKLGYDVKEQEVELIQIAENFFENKDESGGMQDVQQILFIYKISIEGSHEIAKKDEFKELNKDRVILKWITKKEADESDILPEIAKKHIYDSTFRYDIINHKKSKKYN